MDGLAETKIQNRCRKFETAVHTILLGTQLNPEDVVKTLKTEESRTEKRGSAKGNNFVAINIMQLVVLCGAKYLPWTDKRRNDVEYFFTSALIPDSKQLGPAVQLKENGDSVSGKFFVTYISKQL